MELKTEIPSDWNVERISCIADVKTGPFGSSLHASDYVSEGTPIITVEHLGTARIEGANAPRVSTDDRNRLIAYSLMSGDVVFSRVGSIGRFGLVRETEMGWLFSGRLLRVRPGGAICPRFMYFYFCSKKFIDRMLAVAVGQTMPSLNTVIVKGLLMTVPPIREQQAIAGVLSDMDALIESLEKLITKKREMKLGAMQMLLTGTTRLPSFTGDWKTVELGRYATFEKGFGLPKSAVSDNGSEPCLHYGELFTSHPSVVREVKNRCETFSGEKRSQVNDVLMPTSDVTPRGLATASCIQQDGVILGGDVLIIRPDTEILYGPFLSSVIRNSKNEILRMVKGSTVYHIHASDMVSFTLMLPPLKEQQAIAGVLSDMDAEIEALEMLLVKTQDVKLAMAQVLLTGETRLI